MGIVFRQSIKATISTFAGALLGALIVYLSAYFLPKQEFGFRSTLTNYAAVGGQILLLGVNNMIAVYIHRYDSKDKRSSALVTIAFTLPCLFILIASGVYFFFRDQIFAAFKPEDIPFISKFFLWLPVFTLLFAYEVLLETYLIALFKVAKATFMREVLLRLLNLMLILLFGFGYITFDALIYGTVLIYLIPILFLLIIAAQTETFRLSLKWNVFEKREKREIIHFTWYHSLLGVSIIFMGMLDTLMLASLSKNGLRSVPVYTISVFIISFLLIPSRAMMNSTFGTLAAAFKDSDTAKVKDIIMRSSLNIFIASGAMFLVIVCNMHNAVAILPKNYESVAPVVVILAAGRMVDVLTGMNDQALSLSNYYKYNFYISISLVALIMIFNWLLIPVYDVKGAATGTTLAVIIYNVIKLVVVKTKLNIQPVTSRTLMVILAGTFSLLLSYFLPKLVNPFIDGIYRTFLVLGSYVILILLFKPSPDLNSYLASVKKNKRLF